MSATRVPLTPATLRGATLSIALGGATEYDFTAAVVQAMFVPQPDWEQQPVESGTAVSVEAKAVLWTVQVTYVQDFTPGSLARYLFEHTGAQAAARFELAAGQTLTVDVTLLPGTFGGLIGELPLATVELPCWDYPQVVG